MALGLAAFEFHPVDAADEIDHHHIVLGGRRAARPPARSCAWSVARRSSACSISASGTSTGVRRQLELAQIHGLDLRQELEGHLVFQIGAVAEIGDLDLRLPGGPQAPVADDLGRAVADGALQLLAGDLLAPMLGDQGHRHLAGPEAGQAHAALPVLQPGLDPLLKRLSRNHHREFALQAFRNRLCYLHRSPILSRSSRAFGLHIPGAAHLPVPGAGGGT